MTAVEIYQISAEIFTLQKVRRNRLAQMFDEVDLKMFTGGDYVSICQ